MSFLTEDSLPEPRRQNLQRYLDSTVAQIATAIAGARNLEAAAVRDLIDRAPYRGSEAVQLGLVDRLGYWDEVEASVSAAADAPLENRSEEHTSELQSLMRISYAVFCFKKKNFLLSSLSFFLFLSLFFSLYFFFISSLFFFFFFLSFFSFF